MNFNTEYLNRLHSKKIRNDKIKIKFELIYKKKFKKNFNRYQNYIKFLKTNKKKYYHPIRVAYYLFFFKKKINLKNVNLALFHNYFELNLKNDQIFNSSIDKNKKKDLKILKINKLKRWDKIYLKKYYRKLKSASDEAKLIKCIDKLDNLFNLKKNQDLKIKKIYLWEVEKYVLPLSLTVSKKIHFFLNKIYLYNLDLINAKL